MAIQVNDAFSSQTAPGVDATHATETVTKSFASGSITLPRNCPVTFDATAKTWKPLAANGAKTTGTVRGFVYPEDIVLSASGEVLGVIMTAGEINFGDINTAEIKTACGGISEANLKAALREGQATDAVAAGDPATDQPSPRELGLTITGLAEVR